MFRNQIFIKKRPPSLHQNGLRSTTSTGFTDFPLKPIYIHIYQLCIQRQMSRGEHLHHVIHNCVSYYRYYLFINVIFCSFPGSYYLTGTMRRIPKYIFVVLYPTGKIVTYTSEQTTSPDRISKRTFLLNTSSCTDYVIIN